MPNRLSALSLIAALLATGCIDEPQLVLNDEVRHYDVDADGSIEVPLELAAGRMIRLEAVESVGLPLLVLVDEAGMEVARSTAGALEYATALPGTHRLIVLSGAP